MKSKSVKFTNPRTGEIWICEDINQRRKVDGIEFVEVHRPENSRLVWMNLTNLTKIREERSSKKF